MCTAELSCSQTDQGPEQSAWLEKNMLGTGWLSILDVQQAVCPVQPGAHWVHMGISTTPSGVNGVWKEAWEFTGKERKQLASYRWFIEHLLMVCV